jgi:hypothetical protein
MERERPVSVLCLGLLGVVVGGLEVFTGSAALGQWLLGVSAETGGYSRYFGFGVQQSYPVPDLATYLRWEVPGYAAIEISTQLLLFLGGLVLMASSIGLLHMRRWAARTTLGYAVVIAGSQAAYVAYHAIMVLPVTELYYLHDSSSWYWRSGLDDTLSLTAGHWVFLGVPLAVLVPHLLAAVVVLLSPSVRSAFAGKPAVEEMPLPIAVHESGQSTG